MLKVNVLLKTKIITETITVEAENTTEALLTVAREYWDQGILSISAAPVDSERSFS